MDEDWVDSEERVLTTRQKVGRVAIVLFVIAMVIMWTYILLPSSRKDPAGQLDDPAFGTAAEPICAVSEEQLDELPLAHETTIPEERAEVVQQANEILSMMVTQLRPLAPSEGDDSRMVNEWLDDWQIYIGDRGEYAALLAEGDEDARFTETPKAGDHISEALDHFAEVNDMASCATPGDVG
jgi:hypothetical protein